MTTEKSNALQLIQSELKAPKSQYNSFGKYHYRKCEDILEAVKPLLSKHSCELYITDEVIEIGTVVVITACAVFTDKDGKQTVSKAHAGVELQKKGMDVAQTFGASSSYARKYALNGLFLIDDTQDYDSDEHRNQVQGNASQQNNQQKKQNNPQLNQNQQAQQKANVPTHASQLSPDEQKTACISSLDKIDKATTKAQVDKVYAFWNGVPNHQETIGKACQAKVDREGWTNQGGNQP